MRTRNNHTHLHLKDDIVYMLENPDIDTKLFKDILNLVMEYEDLLINRWYLGRWSSKLSEYDSYKFPLHYSIDDNMCIFNYCETILFLIESKP